MIYSIMACDCLGGIGYKDKLPWPYLKSDMQKFVSLTKGHIIVMGYNTFKSINKTPLVGRFNIVIIKKGTIVNKLHNLCLFIDEEDFMNLIKIKNSASSPIKKDIYIIGGMRIFNKFVDLIDVLYLTQVHGVFECDKYIDLKMIQNKFDLTDCGETITTNCIHMHFETRVNKNSLVQQN
jgi:dihydrofolate reductase